MLYSGSVFLTVMFLKTNSFIRSSYTLIRVSMFSFIPLIISQTVGLLGRVIGPSQCSYLNTGQHKHRKTHTYTNNHALSGIGTHEPGERRQFLP
jgi:hypothetical protein